MLEAEVDVLPLGSDPGEVPDAFALGQRVGDPAPAGADRLDGADDSAEDQRTERHAGLADGIGVVVKEELDGLRFVHGRIMLRVVAAVVSGLDGPECQRH